MKTKKFKIGDFVVYPHYGVGKISNICIKNIAEIQDELYVINFPQHRASVSVPVSRPGILRKLSTKCDVDEAYDQLKKCLRYSINYDYNCKLKSGRLYDLAEVIRFLHGKRLCNKQSYKQKSVYDTALLCLAEEIAVIMEQSVDIVKKNVETILSSSSI